MSRERPILFSSPMVRAILEGRKTQTRRVIKLQPDDRDQEIKFENGWLMYRRVGVGWCKDQQCHYGRPGDMLWVRETWGIHDADLARVWFRADPGVEDCVAKSTAGWKWRPSIHMPREHSRITLRLTDVRVERAQDISEKDAIAEGITGPHDVGYKAYRAPDDSKPRYSSAVAAFEALWDSINAKRGHGWDANPWVWVLAFESVRKETA